MFKFLINEIITAYILYTDLNVTIYPLDKVLKNNNMVLLDGKNLQTQNSISFTIAGRVLCAD